MTETLLSPSNVKLFGRKIAGLKIDPDVLPAETGANNFLRSQLVANGAGFARIYGFSYEGRYYTLPRPTVLLVHGDGTPAAPGSTNTRPEMETTGVAARDWELPAGRSAPRPEEDLHVWDYDQADFSMRLDVDTGPLTQILLDATVRAAAATSGMDTRVSGMDARVSGMDARMSGMDTRISGMDARGRR